MHVTGERSEAVQCLLMLHLILKSLYLVVDCHDMAMVQLQYSYSAC